MFSISANDPSLDRTTKEGSSPTYEREVIESRIEEIMGIEVFITTICSSTKFTSVKSEIDSISYYVGYESDNVTVKNTDPVQLDELIKVATSIIEQKEGDVQYEKTFTFRDPVGVTTQWVRT